MSSIDDIRRLALSEDGYLEKQKKYANDNSILNSKLEGAGSDNVTKYWRDICPSLQGKYWCLCFVNWLFDKTFGTVKAKEILYMPSYTYSCTQAISYFKSAKRFYSDARPGDLIFFMDKNRKPCHVGWVTGIRNGYIYTIEGNTSSDAGVVANGGAVNQKMYKIGYSRIIGFGRPKYPDVEQCTTRKMIREGAEGPDVVYLQQRLAEKGYTIGYIDGKFGKLTDSVVQEFQYNEGLKVDGIVGSETWKAIG